MYAICDNKRAIAVDLFSAATANCDLITTKPLNVLLHTLVETWDEMRFSRQSSLLCSHLISPRVWGAGWLQNGRCLFYALSSSSLSVVLNWQTPIRQLQRASVADSIYPVYIPQRRQRQKPRIQSDLECTCTQGWCTMYTKEEWIGCGQIDPYFVDRGIIHLAPSFSFIWVCLLLLRNISFRSRGDFVCAFHILFCKCSFSFTWLLRLCYFIIIL